jgi:hypothetical protein
VQALRVLTVAHHLLWLLTALVVAELKAQEGYNARERRALAVRGGANTDVVPLPSWMSGSQAAGRGSNSESVLVGCCRQQACHKGITTSLTVMSLEPKVQYGAVQYGQSLQCSARGIVHAPHDCVQHNAHLYLWLPMR